MTRSNVYAVLALMGYLLIGDRPVLGAAMQPGSRDAAAVQQTTKTDSIPFGVQPAALLLISMLAGTVVVLVSVTGRETLNSIDFERAYRECHKTTSAPIRN